MLLTVYADILLTLNLIVDYFLLSLTARLLKHKASLLRLIFGSVIGAVSSLYIFLPQFSILFEILTKVSVCVLMCLVTFKSNSIKGFLRSFAVLISVTFGYGGAMIAIWYIFKPYGMVINNSVVYFNISPLFLCLFSVLAYFIIITVNRLTGRNSVCSKKCQIKVYARDSFIELTAILDTGNSLCDNISNGEVIIADEASVLKLFGCHSGSSELNSRFRVIPLNTVSGVGLLNAYRCDKALISYNKKEIELKSPILAVSKVSLGDDYNAILNPQILE